MDRRSFLATGSLAALAVIDSADVTPRHIDPQLVPYFYQQLNGHYAADMMLGPRDLIGTVTEQYRLISGLARAAGGPVREELIRVGATYAELAGWLHQDAGQWDTSAYWHGIAQTDAQMVGDVDLVAYTLSNAAHLRSDLGDGRAAVELCQLGLGHDGLSDRIRVNLMQQQAHGHSLLGPGSRAEVDSLLDAASRVVEGVDPEIPWGTAARRNAYFFEVQRATCYGRMGLHREAQDIWSVINTGMPPAARRDTGVYLTRQATAYAALGEPERAVELARTSAQVAAETRSARHLKELDVLRKGMRRWTKDPVGQRFEEALRPITV